MRKSSFLVGYIVIIFMVVLSTPSHAAKDIEDISIGAEEVDLSGTYPISGKSDDTTTWTGEAKLSKWQTFTTQRGKIYQMFKLLIAYGETEYHGIAVFDGTHLFTACREGNKATYHLLILDQLELSSENFAVVKELHDRTFGSKRDGEVYTWKGDIPWFGNVAYTSEAFGICFFADGTWSDFEVEGCGWPMRTDTAFTYGQHEMKKNGKFEKNSSKQWWQWGKLSVQHIGENVQIDVSEFPHGENDYVGHGMMVKHGGLDRNFLVANMGGPDIAIVGYFEVVGSSLYGLSAFRNSTTRFKETWRIPENVLARNPEWFR